MRAVDLNFDVQAVVAQQDPRQAQPHPAVAPDKLRRIFNAGVSAPSATASTGQIRMAARGQGGCFIQNALA